MRIFQVPIARFQKLWVIQIAPAVAIVSHVFSSHDDASINVALNIGTCPEVQQQSAVLKTRHVF